MMNWQKVFDEFDCMLLNEIFIKWKYSAIIGWTKEENTL